MTSKLSPEYQKIYRNSVWQNLRYAIERYDDALQTNLDKNAIDTWARKITELDAKLGELDEQII